MATPGKAKQKNAKPLTPDQQAAEVLAALKRLASKKTRDGMARYAIPSDNALGVRMGAMQQLAKQVGHNHELAAALWATGCYEARTVAVLVEEPEKVTPAQMDRWSRDFDSWAIVDTACFCLFDRTPHAFRKVDQWSAKNGEYVRRAAFALLACLALHDKKAGNDEFLRRLPLIESAAEDDRNFVKKGVSWALRLIGRRNAELHAAALDLARRLADSSQAPARWVGKDAVKDLTSPAAMRKLAAKK